MGFFSSLLKPIEKAFRPILKTAAPIVAGAIPGVGPLLAPLVGGIVARPRPTASGLVAGPGAVSIQPFPMPGPIVSPVSAGSRLALPQVANGGATPVGIPMVAAGVGAGALVRLLLQKAAQFLGRRVSKSSILQLIRKFGPTAAASAVGWTAAEAVQFWMLTGGTTRRRRRGITARQLASARSVLRRMASFNRMAREACRELGLAGRGGSRTPRHTHVTSVRAVKR